MLISHSNQWIFSYLILDVKCAEHVALSILLAEVQSNPAPNLAYQLAAWIDLNPLTNPKRAPFPNWHEVGWLRNKKVTFKFHFEANRRGALFECKIEDQQGKSNGLWELKHSPDGFHYLLTDIRNRNSWETWNLIIEHNLSARSYFESIKTELLGCCELLAT